MSGDFTFLKGNIETIILCSLINEDKYGYEIAKDIKNRTENKYQIKQPTLYSYLKRLEEDDLITSYWGESSNGGRRRYYRLTANGRSNCEQFISEWQYQRDVLSNLVDTSGEVRAISQDEATPLFGRRSSKKTRKNTVKSQLDEQDEIARRLAALGANFDDEEVEVDSDIEDLLTATVEPEENLQPASQTVVEETVVVVEEVEHAPVVEEVQEPAPQPASQPVEDTQASTLARFEVVQDTPDDFMIGFERLAQVASERQPAAQDTANGENYQHVLMGVLGDQLDDMQNFDAVQQQQQANSFYARRSAPLESIADNFAQEGIRMRIYNHATANYKSKMLVPQAKVLCQSAWLTYLFAVIYFGIIALTSISISNWQPFLITLAVLLIMPVAFSIYASTEPSRKEKVEFNFKKLILAASILCGIIILFTLALNAFGNTQFSDYEQVAEKILIPCGIGLMIPTFVAIFYVLYKKY